MTTTTTSPAGTAPAMAPAHEPDPSPARASRVPSGVRHVAALTVRSLVKIRRSPEQLLDVTLQPIIFIAMFVYLFGGAIAGSRQEYLQFVLPALMVQTVLFSTMAIGTNFHVDLEKGIFDRFRSMPIARSAPLLAAILGDVVRYLVSITVVLGFGYAIGFRIGTDPLQLLGGIVLLVVFTLSLAWVAVLIGLTAREAGSVQGIGFLLVFPLTFGSSMFVPVETMPGWLQSWVHVNPVTQLVGAERALLLGGPATAHVLASLAWAAGITLVFAPLAVRAYRRHT